MAVVIALFLIPSLLTVIPVSATPNVNQGVSAATSSPILNLTSPNPYRGGQFGYSVAISGYYVAVGAPGELVSGVLGQPGRAYVFGATAGKVLFNLTSPNPIEQGEFGYSVAITAKYVVVGAPQETAEGYQYAGNAYVYSLKTGKLVQDLIDPNAQQSGIFGFSVGISGNLAIVGAPGEHSSGQQTAGKAYVFNAANGKLIRILGSPNPQGSDLFGFSVGISGNLAIVGAPGEEHGAGNTYEFYATNGTLIHSLNDPNSQQGQGLSQSFAGEFGVSVAISGKYEISGASGENNTAAIPSAGYTYAYNSSTGSIIQTLKNPNAANDSGFGNSVAISGKIAIVATNPNDGFFDVYVMNAVSGSLISTLNPEGGNFGNSVSISGKLAVVGAPGNTGAAYVFKA